MQGVGIIGWIVIGIAAGFVAEKVMKRDHGLLTNLLVGVVGALLGGWIGSFIVATIGAILLLFLLGLIKKR